MSGIQIRYNSLLPCLGHLFLRNIRGLQEHHCPLHGVLSSLALPFARKTHRGATQSLVTTHFSTSRVEKQGPPAPTLAMVLFGHYPHKTSSNRMPSHWKRRASVRHPPPNLSDRNVVEEVFAARIHRLLFPKEVPV